MPKSRRQNTHEISFRFYQSERSLFFTIYGVNGLPRACRPEQSNSRILFSAIMPSLICFHECQPYGNQMQRSYTSEWFLLLAYSYLAFTIYGNIGKGRGPSPTCYSAMMYRVVSWQCKMLAAGDGEAGASTRGLLPFQANGASLDVPAAAFMRLVCWLHISAKLAPHEDQPGRTFRRTNAIIVIDTDAGTTMFDILQGY